MSDIHIPGLRMAVAEVPPPPTGAAISNWPLSRIVQIGAYIGVMLVSMGTFPEPLNHWVPVILFGVTAATIGIVNAIQSCPMAYLEFAADLSYPRWEATFVFPLPPDLEQTPRIYKAPYPFNPIGVIA